MALINCPECGNEVSDKADVCPKCGFNIGKYLQEEKERSEKEEKERKYREEKDKHDEKIKVLKNIILHHTVDKDLVELKYSKVPKEAKTLETRNEFISSINN